MFDELMNLIVGSATTAELREAYKALAEQNAAVWQQARQANGGYDFMQVEGLTGIADERIAAMDAVGVRLDEMLAEIERRNAVDARAAAADRHATGATAMPGLVAPVDFRTQDTARADLREYFQGWVEGSKAMPPQFDLTPKMEDLAAHYQRAQERNLAQRDPDFRANLDRVNNADYNVTDLAGTLVEARMRANPFRAAGASIQVTEGDNALNVGTLSWVGKKASIKREGESYSTVTSPDTGNIPLTPYEYRAELEATRQFLRSNPFNFEDRLIRGGAQMVENAFLEHITNHAASRPVGWDNTAKSRTLANGAAFAGATGVDAVRGLKYDLDDLLAEFGVYMMKGATYDRCLAINTNQYFPMAPPGNSGQGEQRELFNRPVYLNREVDSFGAAGARPILYGVPEYYWIRDVAGVTIIVDPYTGARNGVMRFHYASSHGGNFISLTNFITVARLVTTAA